MSRKISTRKGSMQYEGMEDFVYKKYELDPNRAQVSAEVGFGAYRFCVRLEAAQAILSHQCLRSDAA